MSIEKYQRRLCDRCGVEVEIPDTDEVDPGWIEVALERIVSRQTNNIPGLPTTFDLCDKCTEGLAQWYAHPAKK